jgi:biotin carboxyl carrier protein
MNISLLFEDQEFKLMLQERVKGSLQVVLDGRSFDVSVDFFSPDEFLLKIDDRVYDVIVSPNSNAYAVCINGKNIHVNKKSALQLIGGMSPHTARREVKTSMPGRIIKLLVSVGDHVSEGEAVLILEAMKMQNEIKSPQPGVVTCIGPEPGKSVEAGALLFVIE